MPTQSQGNNDEAELQGRPRDSTGTPLRRRLFALSAAGILPLALMAGVGLLVLQRQQANQTRRVGLELSQSVANAVDAELRGAVIALETLATSPTLDRDDLAGFRERAKRVRALRPEWVAIRLSATDGTTLVDTRVGENEALEPVMERDSFIKAVRTQAAVIGDLAGDADIGWVFPVRVPVLRDGTLKFIVSANVRPDAIRGVLVRQQLPSDWLISIVDSKGRRVARSEAHEENLGGRLSDTVQQVVDSGGREGFGIAYSLEGERIFTPFTRLPCGWSAVLGLPTAVADGAARRALSTYGGGLLLSILLGVLGALWVARSITGPISDLRAAAEAVGRRQPPILPGTSIQEIRDVAAALGAAGEDLARGENEREQLLRKERQAREAAESADRAKDEFMAILSHELRTPLNAVYGWAKMLQSGQLRDAAAVERAKSAIVRNADIQTQLIDDLLDVSRIASGKLRLNVSRVDLLHVLQAALDAVRPAADAKGIRLRSTLDPTVGSINGDPGRLQQIVWNLLNNSVKFTPQGGAVELRLERAGSQAQVVVVDTGQGVTPEVLPHIFERFRQADSSSTRLHGGLGLGLTLVKHLVELHGGTVHASSPGTGQGATFTVRLPVALADVASRASAAAGSSGSDSRSEHTARLGRLRVLVVDDDAEGLALTEAIVSRAGAEVRACRSAGAALNLVRQWRPDVLVSDIEMPGEDGYSLIRKVRELTKQEGSATPAIALTAYGRSQDRERSFAAGFQMHVPKPIDPGELTTIIAGLVDGAEAPD